MAKELMEFDKIQEETERTETAKAIRAKTGTSTTISWKKGTGFKDAVAAIPTGGGGTDTSDANAAAADIAKDKSAYVKGAKVIGSANVFKTGKMMPGLKSFRKDGSYLVVDNETTADWHIYSNTKVGFSITPNDVGDATPADVAFGKIFTAAGGWRMEGLAKPGTGPDLSSVTATPGDVRPGVKAYTTQGIKDGAMETFDQEPIDPNISIHPIGRTNANTPKLSEIEVIPCDSSLKGGWVSDNGRDIFVLSAATTPNKATENEYIAVRGIRLRPECDPTEVGGRRIVIRLRDSNFIADNIKHDVKIFGLVGAYTGDDPSDGGSSGGSTTYNCEAVTINIPSLKVSFKTQSGPLKAWGYAISGSGFKAAKYAFNGDSYSSVAYGQGDSTQLNLGISPDGNLTGLPSLSSGTLLITRGI